MHLRSIFSLPGQHKSVCLRFVDAAVTTFTLLLFSFCTAAGSMSSAEAIFSLDIHGPHNASRTSHSLIYNDRQRLSRRRIQRRLQSRSEPLTTDLTPDSYLFAYAITLGFGTPPQNVRLELDLNYGDTWVNWPSSVLSRNSTNNCTHFGAYNPNASSTYTFVSNDFNITYPNKHSAIGDYITDTIWIGNASLPNAQFGIAYNSSMNVGLSGFAIHSKRLRILPITSRHIQTYLRLWLTAV
jgi:aspartyl protease